MKEWILQRRTKDNNHHTTFCSLHSLWLTPWLPHMPHTFWESMAMFRMGPSLWKREYWDMMKTPSLVCRTLRTLPCSVKTKKQTQYKWNECLNHRSAVLWTLLQMHNIERYEHSWCHGSKIVYSVFLLLFHCCCCCCWCLVLLSWVFL